MRIWNRAISAVLGSVAMMAITVQSVAEPVVTGIRLGIQGDGTRVVLDMTEHLHFSLFTLDSPYRIVLDLPVVGWKAGLGGEKGLGVVSRFRYGRFDEDTSRLVLDLAGPAQVESALILPPSTVDGHRLVLDVRSIPESEFVADGPPPASTPAVAARAGTRGSALQTRDKVVIALDPGHGGIDPGAVGISGVYEKDVTLAISHEIAAALEATSRYHVVMTRESDRFVALRDRVAIAREAGAELFLSLHADSLHADSPHVKLVRGASVYTLSESASDDEAAKLAERENGTDVIGGLDLGSEDKDVAAILISLTQRESMNLSATFANLLIPEIERDWHLVRNNHRFAGFAVLKAPDVPSVLVELGFLSNVRDERVLSDSGSRKPIVAALVRAVDRYFQQLGG